MSVGGPGAGLGGGVPGAHHAIRAGEAHAGVETGITAEQLVAVSPAAGSDGAGARHIGRGSRRAAPTIVVHPPVVGSQNRLEPTCPRTPHHRIAPRVGATAKPDGTEGSKRPTAACWAAPLRAGTRPR